MVSGETGMIILYVVIGFFGFITIVCGTLFAIFWRRRKLIFTNFLSDTGQWERKSWMPDKLDKTFVYDGITYKYDIKLCTRDKINRPIAHYHKGNPEQLKFDYANANKTITIGTKELTGNDFHVLMLSKVLRDIFQDEEVIQLLWILIIEVAVLGLITIIVVATHNPQVVLKADNQTISVISEGVRQAIMNGGLR
jgi:hypothetical protein